MPPKNRRRQTPAQQPQRIKLGKLLNPNHSLVQLAHAINWAVFEEQFEPLYARKGRPGLSTRLLVGPAGMERLLQETLDAARRAKALRPKDIEKVNVDTTVQEKAIAFPTDARLYHKARRALVRAAKATCV